MLKHAKEPLVAQPKRSCRAQMWSCVRSRVGSSSSCLQIHGPDCLPHNRSPYMVSMRVSLERSGSSGNGVFRSTTNAGNAHIRSSLLCYWILLLTRDTLISRRKRCSLSLSQIIIRKGEILRRCKLQFSLALPECDKFPDIWTPRRSNCWYRDSSKNTLQISQLYHCLRCGR